MLADSTASPAAFPGQPAARAGRRDPGHWPSRPRQPDPQPAASPDAAGPGVCRPTPILPDPAPDGEHNQNRLARTARRLSPEHTQEYRVVPARQHTGSRRAGMPRSVVRPGRSSPDNIRRYERPPPLPRS